VALNLATFPFCYSLVKFINVSMHSDSTTHGSNAKIFSKRLYLSQPHLLNSLDIPAACKGQHYAHKLQCITLTTDHLKASSCHTQNLTQFEHLPLSLPETGWGEKTYTKFSRQIYPKWKVKYLDTQQQKCVIPKTITD
jgi:hypothetical protein